MSGKNIFIIKLMSIILILAATVVVWVNDTEENKIIEIMEKRNDILANFYLNGEDVDKTKSELKLIEAGTLLNEDINGLKKYMKSNLEHINYCKITDVKMKKNISREYYGSCRVNWSGKKNKSENYEFNANYFADRLKLTALIKK